MPRPINPGNITHGSGLAGPRSVEASAFAHPTQGLDSIIAHIIDPYQAHAARAVNIVDAGGFFVAEDVEAALQEIGGGLLGPSQSGVLQGCGFVATGLLITLDSPSFVRRGVELDISGATVTIDNNNVNWVYVDPTGTLTYVSGSTPSFSSPENILLWRIITSGGSVISQTDMRWFVLNSDRKPSLTVRSVGTEVDRNSEASFESLETAMQYLSQYGGGVMRTHTITIKGPLTISSTITIPVDNVVLQGEADCELSTGGSLAPMFNVGNRTNIQFRDILFACEHANSVVASASFPVLGIQFVRCVAASGSTPWEKVCEFTARATDCVIQDCDFEASDTGIALDYPVRVSIRYTRVWDMGSGVCGIRMGPLAGAYAPTADSIVESCYLNGFTDSVVLRGECMKMVGSTIEHSLQTGVRLGADAVDTVLSNNTILLDPTNGLSGVIVSGPSTRTTIANCHIENLRPPAAYVGGTPVGVDVEASADMVSVVHSQIVNFYNSVDEVGFGIQFQDVTRNSLVQGCSIETAQEGIWCGVSNPGMRILGCTIEAVCRGIYLQGDSIIGDTRIALDSTIGFVGIQATGSNIGIVNCRIVNPRAASSYTFGDRPLGIYLNSTTGVSISGCNISGFWADTGGVGDGQGIYCDGSQMTVDGCQIQDTHTGIYLYNGSSYGVSNTIIQNTFAGVQVEGIDCNITGCHISGGDPNVNYPGAQYGIFTGFSTSRVIVTGCRIESSRTSFSGGDDPYGVVFGGSYSKVCQSVIRGWSDASNSTGAGVFSSTGSHCTVADNTLLDNWLAVYLTGSSYGVVSDNVIQSSILEGIVVEGVSSSKITNNMLVEPGSSTGIRVSHSNDVDVVGNTVLGSTLTSTGIVVSGVLGSCRRFVVADNNIQQILYRGIGIVNDVQSGVISNNQIDGFYPSDAGAPQATAGIYVETYSVNLQPRWITIQNNVLWRLQNGIRAYGVDAVTQVRDITISGNNIHHCGAATTMGIALSWCSGVQVTDNSLSRIGMLLDDSGNEVAPSASANVNAYGIWAQDCTTVTCESNTVLSTQAHGTGEGSAINITGPTSLTLNLSVSHNNISSLIGGSSTVGAIVLNMSGTAEAIRVDSNTLFFCGGHGIVARLRPGASVCDWLRVSVSDNTISNQTQSGIYMDLTDGDVGSDAITINNNRLSTLGLSGSDAGIWIQTPTADPISGLSICGNTVTSTSSYAAGIFVNLRHNAYNTDISHNTVRFASGEGIHISTTTNKPSVAFHNTTMVNNRVDSAGNNGFNLSVRREVRNFTFTGNVADLCGDNGLDFDLGTSTSAGTGRAIHVYHNTMRNNTLKDVSISGDNTPNMIGSVSAPGWSCAFNTSSDAAVTGGWGATGTASSFSYQWSQGQNNLDSVTG